MNHPDNPWKGEISMKQHRIFTWASAICVILLFCSYSLPVQANSAAVYWQGASSIAVSYTHLDVYKRQDLGMSRFRRGSLRFREPSAASGLRQQPEPKYKR